MLERWNDAVDAIDERLAESIDIADLARMTLTSEYHFRRVFSALAGMPVSEYVRRRRMTMAAADVLDGAPLADLAVRFGYGSADAFSRAFRSVHGIGPEQARAAGSTLQSQPRLRFHLTLEGASTMQHRIVPLGTFTIVGRCARIPLVHSGPNPDMIAFRRSLPASLDDQLADLADDDLPAGPFSASTGFTDDRADGSLFDYWHGVATRRRPDGLSNSFDELDVPAHTWVVFEVEAHEDFTGAMQALWRDAYGSWFPSNPYRVVPAPEILCVLERADDWSAGRAELWMAVEREDERGYDSGSNMNSRSS